MTPHPHQVSRIPVASSNVKSIGYDMSTRQLHVEFHSGDTYVYHNVPPESHTALMTSKSKGKTLRGIASAYRGAKVPAAP